MIDLPPGVRRGEVFAVQAAREAGYTRGQIRHRLQSGQWSRVVGQVVMDTTRPAGAYERIVAANSTWPEGIVGLRTAAEWYGIPIERARRVEVYTTMHRRPTADLLPLRGTLAPHEVDRRPRSGVAVTTCERTIIDCLALLPENDATAVLAYVMSRSMLCYDDLLTAIADRHGRPGVAQLRMIAKFSRKGAVNKAERRLQELLEAAGLTGWTSVEKVRDGTGRIIADPDILFVRENVIVELDGRSAHGSRRFQDDRTRQNALVMLGYTILRFTWEDLTQRPSYVVATVRAALGR